MERKLWSLEIVSLDIYRIAILSLLVLLSDTFVVSVIYPENSSIIMTGFDVLMTFILGIFGMLIGNRTDIIVFGDSENKGDKNRHAIIQLLLLGLGVVAINTYVWLISYKETVQYVYWVRMLTPLKAVFISLRAAISEEVIFRLFLLSLLLMITKKLMKNEQIAVVLSSSIASILFTFLLHGGSIISFGLGLVLSYVYYKRGLVPTMIIHFIVDVVPFVMVSILLAST